MLFDRARTFIASHETFAEQLVEGLIYLVDRGRKDPIVRILVSPEHMELATTLVGGSGLAAELTGEMWAPILAAAVERGPRSMRNWSMQTWAPILAAAVERGEIRDDLDIADVAEWLALVQFILVGRLDFQRPDDPVHRKLLHSFVLPAFLPVPVVSEKR